MSWKILKRQFALLMSVGLFLLFGCNSAEEMQEESIVSENDVIESIETSEFPEMEDVETIREKALVAYQEYIGSEEILEYATFTGEPDRRFLTKYLIWDANGDGIPELHLNNGKEYFIYTYSLEEDKAVWWKTFYPNLNVRQDNVLIYQWFDSTPDGWKI